MNVNNYGIPIVFSTGYDMSAFTTIELVLTSPSGVVKTFTDPAVFVPGVNIETTAGLFLANEYVQYVTQNGDIDEVGTWGARVWYYDSNVPDGLSSDPTSFCVSP